MITELPVRPEQVASQDSFEKQAALLEQSISDYKSGKTEELADPFQPKGDLDAENNPAPPDAVTENKPVTQEAHKPQLELAKPKPVEKKPDAKPPSNYEKAQARQNEAWKKLNQEKEEVAAQKAEVAKWKADRDAEEAKAEAKKPSPERYEAYAKQLEAAGDYDKAQTARELGAERAAEIKKRDESKPKGPVAEKLWSESEFSSKQAEAWKAAKTELPSLSIVGSPLYNKVQEFMKDPTVNEILSASPNGVHALAKFAESELRAARVPDLETQLKTVNDKLRELESRTTPSVAGGVNEQLEEKAFEDMNYQQQSAYIERTLNVG